MAAHTATRRTLLAGGVAGSALTGLVLGQDGAEGAVGVPVAPTVDFFVALDGIPGESVDAQFPHTFDTLDWSFGESTSVGPTNTGGGVGKVRPQPFVFVKRLDKASTKLFLACATGKHFPKATITCRRRSEKQAFLTFTIKDVFVSSYRVSPGAADAVPLDVVGLDYASLKVTVVEQNAAGGPSQTFTAAFDYVKNRVL